MGPGLSLRENRDDGARLPLYRRFQPPFGAVVFGFVAFDGLAFHIVALPAVAHGFFFF